MPRSKHLHLNGHSRVGRFGGQSRAWNDCVFEFFAFVYFNNESLDLNFLLYFINKIFTPNIPAATWPCVANVLLMCC